MGDGPVQAHHMLITRSGFEACAPCAALEFAEYFKRSDIAWLNREDMDAYMEDMHEFKKSTKVEHAKHSNKKSPVIMSIPMQALALMDRRVQIIRGGIAAQVIQLASFTVQATIMGTVFLQLNSTTFAFFSPSGAWQPPWCPHGLTDSENDGDK
ncbi:hypothetical protein A0H81_13226 [Grifola frondosa]|uniref:Uncharacterized protein n=1 Tax=Grifola frondosa TaxID=5627 RepID=A0A1C7LQ92_GRIFR|nr:hypothetical protein A0H81_13226 [Grifola frondosa]